MHITWSTKPWIETLRQWLSAKELNHMACEVGNYSTTTLFNG
ncbi:hypothetical protein HNQ34_002026 [Anoxybacillus tepidamans]|uniref:Uncharacterized protein n=1 Tax=Anoxybacteroides tepidamans TaxID=265948 RepID=A0A7W8MUV9_9BACL|nr:hypothetical protein [Anoxybacillus tepidamans]MBB5324927.1 hypothetical protein [Anoxybacillus tepidamans]